MYAKAIDEIQSKKIRQGILAFELGNNSSLISSNTNNYYTYDFLTLSTQCQISILYDNGNIPRGGNETAPDFPAYIGGGNRGSNIAYIYSGWNSNKDYNIRKDFVFTCGMHFTFERDENTYLRHFNPLVGFLTNNSNNKIIKNIVNLLIPHLDKVSDYVNTNSTFTYSGARQFVKYYRWKFQKVSTLQQAISIFKNDLVNRYNLSDAESFHTAWTSGWGVEYIGRIMLLAYEYYKDCVSNNLTDDINYFANLTIECGKFFANLFNEYGDIPLNYSGGIYSVRNNSRTSGLHCMANALAIDNTLSEVSIAYQNLGQVIIENSDFNTMLKDGNLSTSRYNHYMSFALYDFLMSIKLVPLNSYEGFTNYDNFLIDATTALGQVKDQVFCPATNRRGQPHTYAYFIGSLVLQNEATLCELAEVLTRNLVSNELPLDFMIYPLDKYDDTDFKFNDLIGNCYLELGGFITLLNYLNDKLRKIN